MTIDAFDFGLILFFLGFSTAFVIIKIFEVLDMVARNVR